MIQSGNSYQVMKREITVSSKFSLKFLKVSVYIWSWESLNKWFKGLESKQGIVVYKSCPASNVH